MNFSGTLKTVLASACGVFALATVGTISAPAPASAQGLHAYCDNYALEEAHSRGRGRVATGSVVGAATGAIIGGIVGGGRAAAIGAASGAAAGALGGQASKRVRRGRVYRMAYNDCIAANSRQRAAPVRGSFEPWSPAWYDYCRSRYRSFNPRTGYFTTYSGRQKFCR